MKSQALSGESQKVRWMRVTLEAFKQVEAKKGLYQGTEKKQLSLKIIWQQCEGHSEREDQRRRASERLHWNAKKTKVQME
jgi:hypothetical protein